MTEQEKMEELVDVLEMDLGEFDRDTVLEEVETWDSVAVLSFIAFMNEKFDKIFHASEIAVCKTVGDLMDMMTFNGYEKGFPFKEVDTMENKLKKLEQLFEMQEGTLRPDTLLKDLEEWDSITRLSFVVMMEDDYGKKVTRTEVMNYKTVSDILDGMV